MVDTSIVHLWVDNATVGCGERLFVVLKVGPKFVQLFDPNQLKFIMVERGIFEKQAKPASASPRKVRSLLKANAKDYRRFGRHYSKRYVQAAETVLAE